MAYAVSVLIQGRPVMGDTIEAGCASDARAATAVKFWRAADELRAAMPRMSDADRPYAARMVAHIEAHHEDARKFGLVVEARKSRRS